jgi:hypothetical protein
MTYLNRLDTVGLHLVAAMFNRLREDLGYFLGSCVWLI